MIIKSALFVSSSTDVKRCPGPDKPEFAFVGRSNVGKSSLINMLTGQKGLAKISTTPGKTQLINHFLINNQWYLADLPGYGYARISLAKRYEWEKIIQRYLSLRKNLMNSFLLIDARLPMQEIDRELIGWFGEKQMPFVLVFTKTDKLSKNDLEANLRDYRGKLSDTWEELPQIFLTSSRFGFGRSEILNFIEEVNRLFK
jgi:GTP-binding protein